MAAYINLDDPEVRYSHNCGKSEVYIVGSEAERIDIVRCGECKYRHRDQWGWYCDNDTADPYERTRSAEDANWFCADGERRDDDETD